MKPEHPPAQSGPHAAPATPVILPDIDFAARPAASTTAPALEAIHRPVPAPEIHGDGLTRCTTNDGHDLRLET
jgi:hypothetical protein